MGVNSFGFGGANAHVVIQAYSAAATRRQEHPHRLAVFGRSAAELAKRLGSFAVSEAGAHIEGVVRGRIVSRNARLVLLFSGNGSQWQGMGRRLLATDRLFRRYVKKVDDLLRPLTGFGVLAELNRRPEDSRLHLTEIAQPLVFALQIGLFETLVARGVVVEAVLGHSVGEVAADYAAGTFDLPEAVGIIHHRSAAQALTRGLGRMAAVGLSQADAIDEMTAFGDDLERSLQFGHLNGTAPQGASRGSGAAPFLLPASCYSSEVRSVALHSSARS